MSGNGSSSAAEVQPNEPTQTTNTAINNEEIKKNDSMTASDDHDKVKVTTTDESLLSTPSDENQKNNPSTPKLEATTNEPTTAVTNPIPGSSFNTTTTTTSPDTNEKATESSTHETSPRKDIQPETTAVEASTSQDSVSNEKKDTEANKESIGADDSLLHDKSDAKSDTKQATDPTITEGDKEQKNLENVGSGINNQLPQHIENKERKNLENLIRQELSFVKQFSPKLEKHRQTMMDETQNFSDKFYKMVSEEPFCDLKELRDLQKTITKLKLKIPAKYRIYEESDEQKNEQFDMEYKGISNPNLLKMMPRLHKKLFNMSSFCKSIQKRYNKLMHELKLCLLCFSMFPEKAIISRRVMIYLWVTEGFIHQDHLKDEKTMEDCANDYFKVLIKEGFIEPVSTSYSSPFSVAACKMHPMVRAALVMIADKVNFFDFDQYGNPKDFGKFEEIESPEDMKSHPLCDPREFFEFFNKDGKRIEENIEFSDKTGNPTSFASLSQQKSRIRYDRDGKEIQKDKKLYFYEKKKITTRSYMVCLMGSGLSNGIAWEKLHMLFNVRDDVLELKHEWFLRMKNVNVLFLGKWESSAAHHIEVDEFHFKNSLEHMNHVRFFSLQGVSRIKEIPMSISKLKDLLILDLRACSDLEVIPKSIGSLKCLTHLDLSECYLLKDIPKEISSLQSLQVLKGFIVFDSTRKNECTIDNLRKLENLRKLSLYTHMSEFPEESHIDELQKLEMLRKLSILWRPSDKSNTNDETEKKFKPLCSPMNLISKKICVQGSMRRMNAFNSSTLGSRLEKLDLKCFPKNVTPDWLKPDSLKGLKKLYIHGGKFADLGQYEDNLEPDDSPTVPKDTWNVEILRLKYLDELKMEWRELQNLFPNMISLEKVKCPMLTLFPCDEYGVWTKKTANEHLI